MVNKKKWNRYKIIIAKIFALEFSFMRAKRGQADGGTAVP